MTDKEFFEKEKGLFKHDEMDIFVVKNILKELFNIETISADENGKMGHFPDLYVDDQTIGFEVTEVSKIQRRDYYMKEIRRTESKSEKQNLLIKMIENCNCFWDDKYGFVYSVYEKKDCAYTKGYYPLKIDLKVFLKIKEQPNYNEERFIIDNITGISSYYYIERIKKAIEKKGQKKKKGCYNGVKKTFLFLIDYEFIIFSHCIKKEEILNIESPFEKIYYLDQCGLLIIDFKEQNVSHIKGDFLFKHQSVLLKQKGLY